MPVVGTQIQDPQLKLSMGIQVNGDISGTIYQKMGLQVRDVITHINGRAVGQVIANRSAFLKSHTRNTYLELRVFRAGAIGSQTIDFIANGDSQKIGNKNNPIDLVSGKTLDEQEGKALVEGLLISLVRYVAEDFRTEKTAEGRVVRVVEVPDAPARPEREPKGPTTPRAESPSSPISPPQPEVPIVQPESEPQDEPENPDGDGEDDDDEGDGIGEPTPDNEDDYLPADPDGSGNLDDTGKNRV
jgi:hypothetical protein